MVCVMKIEGLIKSKNDHAMLDMDGISIPVIVLKKLIEEGYDNIRIYKENNTFSLWGKNCTACFSEAQLLERGGSA